MKITVTYKPVTVTVPRSFESEVASLLAVLSSDHTAGVQPSPKAAQKRLDQILDALDGRALLGSAVRDTVRPISGKTIAASLALDDVLSVYSGKPGKCCCGCSGLHRYASRFRREASEGRGYKVTDDEVNDTRVKRLLGIVQDAPEVEVGSNNVSAVVDGRLYVVYVRRCAESKL